MASPPLPRITPMAPTLVAQPFHHEGWVYEEKYDGWRMVAYKEGLAVRLVSRVGKDQSRPFAGLTVADLRNKDPFPSGTGRGFC